jgi:hypothetical protein
LVRLLIVVMLFACAISTGGVATGEDQAQIKLINAVPGLGPVDIFVDGAEVQGDVAFGTATNFVRITPGTKEVTIRRAGDSDELLLSGERTFSPDATDELILVDHNATLQLIRFAVDLSAMSAGETRFRVVLATDDLPAAEVLGREGQLLSTNLAALMATDYVEVPEGIQQLAIRVANEQTDRLVFPETRLIAGTVYDFVVMSQADGSLAVTLVSASSITPTGGGAVGSPIASPVVQGAVRRGVMR